MKKSERVVLDHFLSDYPENKTFDEICSLIIEGSEKEDDYVCVWFAYEDWDDEFTVSTMKSLAVSIEEIIK